MNAILRKILSLSKILQSLNRNEYFHRIYYDNTTCTTCGLTNILSAFQRGAFVSEPAIQVKRKGEVGSQVWSMDKFENKIIDMREMYQDRKEKGLPMMVEFPTLVRRMSTSSAGTAANVCCGDVVRVPGGESGQLLCGQ